MNYHTDGEIKAFILDIYKVMDEDPNLWLPSGIEVEVPVNTPEVVRIKVNAMYDTPPMNTRLLFPLCEYLGTKNINDIDHWSEGGCETCDYGSSYGFELEAKPEGVGK